MNNLIDRTIEINTIIRNNLANDDSITAKNLVRAIDEFLKTR